MNLILKGAFLLITLGLVASFEYDEGVLVLTNDNFDQALSEYPVILVEFYAPWCGHCKKLAPEYAKAAQALKDIAVIAKIDADAEQNRAVSQRFGIRGFPTLKLFRNGESSEYDAARTSDAIVAYMKKQVAPAIRELTAVADANAFTAEDRVVVIGFFASKDSTEYQTFAQTAEKLRNRYTFGAVVNQPAINTEFEVTTLPNVILFKQFDEGKNVLGSNLEGLEAAIAEKSVPLIDEIGQHNYKNYVDSGLPLAYLFVDPKVEGQLKQYTGFIRPVAEATKGKVNWVFIDWGKYAKHSERLGLSGQTVPALAIENLAKGTHYAFDEAAQINTESIQAWVNSFLSGELQPTIKSEEIPADNNGPVKILVAKNFDEIVNDPTKDVLVEFYAPWCGHCKALAPIYEELGTELKSSPNVVIAKIDATANDVNPNFGIRGFPTIKLFPAGNKAEPIDYEGDRTKGDFISFLKSNGVNIEGAAAAADSKDEL